jgi:hypothetical protein
MAVKFANLASATLASATTNSATSLTVSDASSFPSLGGGDYFYASIGEGLSSEIVKVTAVSSNTLTATRGQDGTTAVAHSSGTVIALRVVAAALDDIASQAQTAADTESVSIAGDTMTGNLSFGDNVKATFGDNDLQIYHSGSASYITDSGTGNLLIQGTDVRLQNAGATANYLKGTDGAEVSLFYAGGQKLATSGSGIEVTGAISSGAITSTGKLTLNDPSVGGWIQSNGSIRIDIDNDNDQTNRAFIVSKDNGATNLLTIYEDAAATFAGTGAFSGKLTISNGNYANHLELVRGSDTLYLTPSGGQLLTNGGLSPAVTNQYALGRTDKYWQDLWLGTSLKMGGTTVINASRNLINIGTISSGAITSSGTITTSGSFVGVNAIVDNVIAKTSGGNILFKTNGGSSIARFNNNQSADFFGAINSSGLIKGTRSITSADVDYLRLQMSSWSQHAGYLKSLVWHDGANNIAGIGAEYDQSKTNIHFHSQYNAGYKGTSVKTFSVFGNGNVDVLGTTLSVGNATGGNQFFKRPSANYIFADQTGGYLVFGTNGLSTSLANASLRLDTSKNAIFGGTITSGAITSTGTSTFGGVQIGGTTVISSSRNLTNIGTISSQAITSVGNASISNPSAGASITLRRTDVNTSGIFLVGSSFSYIGTTTNKPFHLYQNNASALQIDTSKDATFAGNISSGDITSTGTGTFGTQVALAKQGTATSSSAQFSSASVAFEASGWDVNNAISRTGVWTIYNAPTASNFPDFDLNFYEPGNGLKFQLHGRGSNNYVDPLAASFYGNVNINADSSSAADGGDGSLTVAGAIGAGGAAESFYDLKVYGLARFQGSANFVSATNPIQVGGVTLVDASRNITAGAITSSGQLSVSGNNLAVFGPNSLYSRSLAIGGNANNSTSTRASIGTTNGNLHIDAATGAFGTYLNLYDGTGGVHLGNGVGATAAHFNASGHLSLAGNAGGHISGYALSVGGVGVVSTSRNISASAITADSATLGSAAASANVALQVSPPTGNNQSGLKITNTDGGAHTWLGYYDGNNYLTGDADVATGGKTYIRSESGGAYSNIATFSPTSIVFSKSITSGAITSSGIVDAPYFIGGSGGYRVKFSVWSGTTYGIGMKNGFSYGGLASNYAMCFQMNTTAGRGFWWGTTGNSDAQGAMALTNDGKLTVNHSMRLGYGVNDTTTPGATHALDVSGTSVFTTADNSAQVTLISTDTDASVGPQLNLWRNSGLGSNGDLIGKITFTGEDTVGSTNTFATIYGVADQANNGAEDGSIHFQTLINGVLEDRFEINSAGNSVFTGIINNTRGNSSVAPPNTADHTAGTRISFYDASATSWYAMGIESSTLWFNSDANYKWYQDGTLRMSLLGANLAVTGTLNSGAITSSGQVTGTRFTDAANPTAYFVQPSAISFIHELRVDDFIRHNGDTDTHIKFLTDRVQLTAGNVLMLDCVEGGTDYIDIINRVRVTAGGNLECEGNITAYTTTSISDINQKENIQQISDPIEKVKQISGYTFDWKNSGEHSGGVIAQEVEQIMPDVVKEVSIRDGDEMKAVDYQAIIGLLVETVKDLNKRIEDLENGDN